MSAYLDLAPLRASLLASVARAERRGDIIKAIRLLVEIRDAAPVPPPVMPRMPIGARSTTTPRHLPPRTPFHAARDKGAS